MAMKQQTKIVTCSVVVVCIILMLLYASITCNRTPIYTLWAPPPAQKFEIKSYVQHDKGLAGRHTARFLVLVQAESCLTNHLSSEEAFGNATFCQCDVLVLAFERECNETSPAHIKHVFKPGTTWNEGRNFLLEVGRNRSEKYLYYIFTDDDVDLMTELNINPWRTFLDFLLDVEPAVGIVDFPWNVEEELEGMERLGCGVDANSTNYVNAPNFDSAFNAFHYQAIDYILPYPTQFDKLSWWYSGYYSKVKCDIMFPGQTLVLTKITMFNPRHRPYPRKNPFDSHNWNIIMREVEAPLPEEYRNLELLKGWKRLGMKNQDKSASLCFPLPAPHTPIRPFSYLESIANDSCSC
jgi:hypothetical protein